MEFVFDNTPDADQTEDPSPSLFAHILWLSGFIGLAAGLGLEAYRLILLDSVFGTGTAPDWVEVGRFSLIAGSLAVLFFATVIDDVFEGWLDVVLGCAIAGQWGVPIALYLDATSGSASSPYGFIVIVAAGLHALIASAVAINYARRRWPTANRLTG